MSGSFPDSTRERVAKLIPISLAVDLIPFSPLFFRSICPKFSRVIFTIHSPFLGCFTNEKVFAQANTEYYIVTVVKHCSAVETYYKNGGFARITLINMQFGGVAGNKNNHKSNPIERLKSMGKNQHVVPNGSGWGVRGEGNQRLTSTHKTQRSAIESAREIAINQGSELFIHGQNGQFRNRNSYGND